MNEQPIANQYLLTEGDMTVKHSLSKFFVCDGGGVNDRWGGSMEMGVWKPEDSRTEWGHLG